MQAGLWVRATSHTHSETDKQNREQQHPPNEIPGILGMTLLIAAGVIAGVPQQGIITEAQSVILRCFIVSGLHGL